MNASFYHTPRKNWFFKYHLYQIPFWYLYNYVWWSITVQDFVRAAADICFSSFSIKMSFYALSQTAAVYFTLYFLVPKLLEKDRLLLFGIGVVLTIFAASACITPGYFVTAWVMHKPMDALFGPGPFHFIPMTLGTPLSSTTACITFALTIKLTKNWLQTQRRQQLLEKEKLETELNFLKYQFNPHFLFNSINSIFFLIHKNPDVASASLAKFSELLRYQLYDCNDAQILLRNEIVYLENFIELEKLRLNHNVRVTADLEVPAAADFQIAPFILMTFVENAFKHVSKNTEGDNWINIDMRLDGGQLHFLVANSTGDVASRDVMQYGGIGLKNVQRRLDLLYPGQYGLDVTQNDHSFEVRFALQLPAPAMVAAPMALTF